MTSGPQDYISGGWTLIGALNHKLHYAVMCAVCSVALIRATYSMLKLLEIQYKHQQPVRCYYFYNHLQKIFWRDIYEHCKRSYQYCCLFFKRSPLLQIEENWISTFLGHTYVHINLHQCTKTLKYVTVFSMSKVNSSQRGT